MRLLALRAETMQAMRRLKLPCDDITPIGLWGSDMFLIGVNNDQFEVLRLWNVQTEDVTPATLRDLHSDSPAIPTSPSAGNAASGARSPARKGAPSAAPSSPTPAAEQSTAPRSASPAPAYESVAADAPLAVEPDDDSPLMNPSAARGRSPLEIQAPFEAVAQAPAPEAPSARTPSSGSASSGRAENGSAGKPVATPPAASGSERRDGPDLKLEPSASSSTSRSSRSEEGRSPKAARGETQLKGPAKESAKDTAKDGGSNAGKLRMTVDGEHLYAEIKGGKIVLKDRTYDSLAHARDSIRRERNKVAVWEYFDEGVKAWRVLNRD